MKTREHLPGNRGLFCLIQWMLIEYECLDLVRQNGVSVQLFSALKLCSHKSLRLNFLNINGNLECKNQEFIILRVTGQVRPPVFLHFHTYLSHNFHPCSSGTLFTSRCLYQCIGFYSQLIHPFGAIWERIFIDRCVQFTAALVDCPLSVFTYRIVSAK